jgi:tetratricopeptide (TPR) repeat protein
MDTQSDKTKTSNILQMLIGIVGVGFFLFLFGGAWSGFFRMPRALAPAEEKQPGRIARYEAFYEALAAQKPSDAVKAAQVIFSKDPKGPKIDEVRRLTLDAYLNLRRYDEAIVMAQVLSNAHPKDPKFRFVMAESFLQLGRVRDAQNTYLELSLRKDLTQKERDDVRDALRQLNDDPRAIPTTPRLPGAKGKGNEESDTPPTPFPLDLPLATPIPFLPSEKNPDLDPLGHPDKDTKGATEEILQTKTETTKINKKVDKEVGKEKAPLNLEPPATPIPREKKPIRKP